MKDPIFILSAGPRCGSTWLQRILTSTGGVFIWGESFHLWPIDNALVTPDAPNVARENDMHYFREHGVDMWMATIKPTLQDHLEAFKMLLERLFAVPAEREGFPCWGMKETKWEPFAPNFILSQWPEAKIIFLVRNFRSTYMSQFKNRLPKESQNSNRESDLDIFAAQYAGQLQEICKWQENPRCRIIKHEDHAGEGGREKVAELLEWCGLPGADWEKAGTKISYHKWRPDQDITKYKPQDLDYMWLYRDRLLDLSKQFGYEIGM